MPAPTVEVVDTIGAGDAFGGGFLAWWRRAGSAPATSRDADAVRRGDALRLRRGGPHGRARGRLAAAARRGRYGLTIGFTLRGSSRPARSAASVSSSAKWPVTIASRSTAAGRRERDRRRVGVRVAERAGQPDLAALDRRQRELGRRRRPMPTSDGGAGRPQRRDAGAQRGGMARALDQRVGLARQSGPASACASRRCARELQPVLVDVGDRRLGRARTRARPAWPAARSARRR